MNAQADAVDKYFRAREYVVRCEGALGVLQDMRHKAQVMVAHSLDPEGSLANDAEKLSPVIAAKEAELIRAEDTVSELFIAAKEAGVTL